MKLKTTFSQKTVLILFGIFLALFLVEAGLHICGFTLTYIQEHKNRASLNKEGTYRILCLGESTTQRAWPPFLEAALNRSGTGLQFTVIDEGWAGTTTTRIVGRTEYYLDKYKPDMVVTMMGINDAGAAHLPDEHPSASKIVSVSKSLKIYKLTRLFIHLVFKTGGWALPAPGAQATEIPPTPTSAAGPNAQDTEPVKTAQGRRQQAEEESKKALELKPGDSGRHVAFGRAYWRQSKFKQAEEEFKKAARINPREDRGHFELGRLYQKQGKLQQAEEEFKKALELKPEDSNRHSALGLAYWKQRKLQQAEEEFKKAIQLTPGNDKTHFELGRLYQEQGKFRQAEEEFEKTLELKPEDSNRHEALGRAYWRQRKFQQAEKEFKKALELKPGNNNIHIVLGTTYREQGEFQQAEEEFKKALELDPGDSDRHTDLGKVYQDRGKLQQAEEEFKKALGLKPGDSNTHVALGGTYWEQGRVQQAEEEFKKALKLDPGKASTCDILGKIYQAQGKSQQAEEEFKKALKLNPENSDRHAALGIAYQEQGKFKQAEEEFKKALQINPGDDNAYHGLEHLSRGKDRFRQEAYYQKAIRLNTNGYNPVTANSYRTLKAILDKRKIRIVCVQYPMRGMESLRNIFAGKTDNIVFVDNKKIFSDAVKKEGFAAYFIDIFGGNFGHCTDKGNKLLGENIAKVILEEVFHK
ncbi:MAG: hypothetical protein A2234_06885 [Elusimicrobia bacterium RIFOXYA2_FULL_58_8]|nr:MAG: hypothetical protein A2285_00410 [Elusimicrobia bacterium RIFOXYA12_FULL_57_11]OGS16685.1 MAG: hypothetical protein A2234_06885 [Elusimicrobia bacterium RIFOXYA2_FULL_58_8]